MSLLFVSIFQGHPGPMGSSGYPGTRGVKVHHLTHASLHMIDFNFPSISSRLYSPLYPGCWGHQRPKRWQRRKGKHLRSLLLSLNVADRCHSSKNGPIIAVIPSQMRLPLNPGKVEKLLKAHQAGSKVSVPVSCNGVWNIKVEWLLFVG